MALDTRQIQEVRFGLYTPEEILALSQCEINNPKREGHGSVYDPRMGTLDRNKCETCGENAKICPGHYGHIELRVRIIHPEYYKQVICYLQCMCLKCYNLLITKAEVELHGLNKYTSQVRFDKILKKVKDMDSCPHCMARHAKYVLTDETIHRVHTSNSVKTELPLTPDEIKRAFDNLSDDDVRLLGFDPVVVHPRSFILVRLLVMPQCARPYVKKDGDLFDDDFTNQYIQIIHANNKLASPDINEVKRRDLEGVIKFRIATTFCNSKGKAKHPITSRAIQCIRGRLSGKKGQLRENLSGKRCVGSKELILMWDGNRKTADSIKIGDVLIGDDGWPRRVLDTCSGIGELYRIDQSRKGSYIVNENHTLTLRYSIHLSIVWNKSDSRWTTRWFDPSVMTVRVKSVMVTKTKTKSQAFDEITEFVDTIDPNDTFDVPLQSYLSMGKTVQLAMLGVQLNTSVNWIAQKVILDPYILGMWLGDGKSRGYGFTSIDPELIEYWTVWAAKNDSYISQHKIAIQYGVCSNTKGGSYKSALKKGLEHYNLLLNKHIPDDYIYNSKEVRLALLAGLIDTDGWTEYDGTCANITQSHDHSRILDGAEFIAQSLGIGTRRWVRKTSWTSKGVKKTGTALTLSMSGIGLENIPTLLPRKKCYPPKLKRTTSYKITATPIGIGPYSGFEVDLNNRFLLGDFTITHNCEQSGRTVISPDSSLRMDEVGIPVNMANILTVPERVTQYNIDLLQKLVNSGEVSYDPITQKVTDTGRVEYVLTPDGKVRYTMSQYRRGVKLSGGDVIFRDGKEIEVVTGRELALEGDYIERNGKALEDVRYANRPYKLELGWVVERKLQDGDIVLINRQPTLHRGSMMAMKVRVLPHKTIRMNLACTSSLNADGINVSNSER